MFPLSPHLYWDVKTDEVDPEQHAAWLVRRVLEYGDWPDWQAVHRYYGKERLAGIVTGIRSLHPRALAFSKVWFGLAASAFRCSSETQCLWQPVGLAPHVCGKRGFGRKSAVFFGGYGQIAASNPSNSRLKPRFPRPHASSPAGC